MINLQLVTSELLQVTLYKVYHLTQFNNYCIISQHLKLYKSLFDRRVINEHVPVHSLMFYCTRAVHTQQQLFIVKAI
jgi:hypothetical protein